MATIKLAIFNASCKRHQGMKVIMKIFFACLLLCSTLVARAENVLIGKIDLVEESGAKVKDASNLVVFIEDVKGEFKTPNTHASLASKNKEFFPNVLPILKGTTVDFPNADLIMHNVFSLSKSNPFDLGLYEKGAGKSFKFDKSGLVKIYCNIHEAMVGNILVLENPFFTLTDESGHFKIENIPSGNHKVSVWHRFGKIVSKEVSLNGKDELKIGFKVIKGKEIDLELKQINISIKHKNKWGQDYKAKY